MSTIEVKAIGIPTILENLHSGEWLTPEFQRDFVWTTSQIVSLINSIVDAKPIGMATLWQQEEKSDLPLEHISVNDFIHQTSKSGPRYFGDNIARPGRYYAILDGKQRSTAIAMAFGGLRAESGTYRYSGGYFINADYDDVQDRVTYLSKLEIERRQLNTISAYVSSALFPIALKGFDKLVQHFFEFIAAIDNDQNYPEGQLISRDQKDARKRVIQSAYEGIQETRLAVYIVPKEESLGEICDIFEVLNTTGTKVTTVDLIHSSIYAETVDTEHPVHIRDEIDLLSELDGLQGWSTSQNRPELVAQNIAAVQIALDKKHAPRRVAGRKETRISSIKSSDLLAISSNSWRDYFRHKEFVAQVFLDFQHEVAGGRFTLSQCPYPAMFNIYISLRWYWEHDRTPETAWSVNHLNRLFRAFFWRNTFSRRYDQGFLTRVSADIDVFKNFLQRTSSNSDDQVWQGEADHFLNRLPLMYSLQSLEDEVWEAVTNGNTRGALRDGAILLLHTRAQNDFVDLAQDISNVTSRHDLHHIFAKRWCKDNLTNANKEYLTVSKEGRNWVDSPANLIPMSSKSNKKWDTMEPSAAMGSLGVKTEEQLEQLRKYFIDADCLKLLEQGGVSVGGFLQARAKLLQKEIVRLMRV